jgi:serine phosphatase RsbU (regulator of sigma subunit)
MALAHKQIGDSIDYASLIQRAFLPARQMTQSLGEHHFVMWMPRDVVGGDFYVFRADGENCLLGVADCAGHGVPGALMTMLSRTAIDSAIAERGVRGPAGILSRTDAALRSMVDDAELPRTMATSMDAGLAYIDRKRRRLTYAGAKLALFASNGYDVVEYPGTRRALGSKRLGDFENVEFDMPADCTYCLVTDGFLDQAGGDQGFSFGTARFRDILRDHAGLPLTQQTAAFVRILSDYQGTLPQRDDITLLAFRFD